MRESLLGEECDDRYLWIAKNATAFSHPLTMLIVAVSNIKLLVIIINK